MGSFESQGGKAFLVEEPAGKVDGQGRGECQDEDNQQTVVIEDFPLSDVPEQGADQKDQGSKKHKERDEKEDPPAGAQSVLGGIEKVSDLKGKKVVFSTWHIHFLPIFFLLKLLNDHDNVKENVTKS